MKAVGACRLESDHRLVVIITTGAVQDDLDALSFEEFDLNGDLVQNRTVYFSLAVNLPSLALGGGFSPADILFSPAGGGAFGVFATANQMGLVPGDDLDALALLDFDGNGVATPGVDLALFSLSRNSPSGSAADLFLTTFNGTSAVRYTAASLGLLASAVSS